MDRNNRESANGGKVVVRFCLCGHAAVISSDRRDEFAEFYAMWECDHTGPDHRQVDFDTWLENAMRPKVLLSAK